MFIYSVSWLYFLMFSGVTVYPAHFSKKNQLLNEDSGSRLFSLAVSRGKYICAMVKSRYIGDGHPTFNRNPYNGYINPYYWVDDHPLLYGNNGSLDPSSLGSLLDQI